MDDLISRQAAIDAECEVCQIAPKKERGHNCIYYVHGCKEIECLRVLPSAQPERLTDDDFETIRIHLSALKEELCNQHRWEEAEEYQQIINRFMSFANAQQERKKGHWLPDNSFHYDTRHICSECKLPFRVETFMGKPTWRFCPNCGAEMGWWNEEAEE